MSHWKKPTWSRWSWYYNEFYFSLHNNVQRIHIKYDDVMKWKHFPRHWPFVRGIHRSPVNSPHKRPVTRSFDVFFDLGLNKRLSKQSRRWLFKTPSCSLWRHCNDMGYEPSAECRADRTLDKISSKFLWVSMILYPPFIPDHVIQNGRRDLEISRYSRSRQWSKLFIPVMLLKRKCRYFDEVIVTDCIWRKFRRNGYIPFTWVLVIYR